METCCRDTAQTHTRRSWLERPQALDSLLREAVDSKALLVAAERTRYESVPSAKADLLLSIVYPWSSADYVPRMMSEHVCFVGMPAVRSRNYEENRRGFHVVVIQKLMTGAHTQSLGSARS